jgi:hypothetical protein
MKRSLAATGRPLEQHRQFDAVGRLEHRQFVADGFVVGFLGDEILFRLQGADGHGNSSVKLVD